MAVILLVRHGQSTMGVGGYDGLSKRGIEQSRILGEALAKRGIKPSLLVSGDQKRHRETLSSLADAAGWDIPYNPDPGWNEFDHAAVIGVLKPAYRNNVVMAADLARTLNPRRAFQQTYEEAVARWVVTEPDEAVAAGYPETFSAFRARVSAALRRTSRQLKSGETAVVVTSGGPISSVLTDLFGGDTEVWQRSHLVLVNTGVTKVVTGRRGTTLVSYNEHTHLEGDPDLVTYR